MKQDDSKILAVLNPIGFKISTEDVDNILSGKNDNAAEWLARFFHCDTKFLSEKLLTRYARACDVITNISIGTFHSEIKERLINPMASAKRCYCYEELLATIQLCALQGEMLASYLLIINKKFLGNFHLPNNISKTSKDKIKKFLKGGLKSDELNQNNRLTLLFSNKVISDSQKKDLERVHEIRVCFFHHWEQDHGSAESLALECLEKISKVSSDFIEILGRTENISNIKAYISSVEH